MTTIAPTPTNVDRLLADVDRLSRVNQQLRARVEVLEQVEVAAHRLLSAKPTMERDARERLLAAIKRAEVVAG